MDSLGSLLAAALLVMKPIPGQTTPDAARPTLKEAPPTQELTPAEVKLAPHWEAMEAPQTDSKPDLPPRILDPGRVDWDEGVMVDPDVGARLNVDTMGETGLL